MNKHKPPISIERLMNSALAADSMMPLDFRNEADLTPEERERGETRRHWTRQRRSAVSTAGKSKEEIVRDVADALRKAGLLKETPPTSDKAPRPSDKKLPR